MQCTETSSGVPITVAGIRIVNSILLSTFGSAAPVNKIPFAEILSVIASKVPSDVVTSTESFIGKRTAVRNAFVIRIFDPIYSSHGPEPQRLTCFIGVAYPTQLFLSSLILVTPDFFG
jgi:hypothetical protein